MLLNIKGMDRAKILAALYNAARPIGLGVLSYDPTPMSEAEAGYLLKTGTYFDYYRGRVMKIELAGERGDPDLLFTDFYDRDNGPGAAERAIRSIK